MKLRHGMIRHGMIGGVLLLAGCGLPPAVVIASYAVDGISYLATGKSVPDHALSAVRQQDCALHRFVTEGGNVCSQTLSDDVLLAAADAERVAEPDLDATAITAPADVAVLVAAAAPVVTIGDAVRGDGAGGEAIVPDDTQTAVYGGVTAVPSRARYLVIGSFANAENAGRLVDGLTTLSAAATTADVDGRTMHRVVVPADMDAQVAAAGFADAWPIDLCAASLTEAPCAVDVEPMTFLAALPQ